MSQEVDDFLEHYGVKGMKWGKRTARPAGTPRKTEREASKDAKETARAKMYYGEGAGVRRRLIKNSVQSKLKDPAYKEAYERHLADQNMAKRASEARSKRKRTDATNATKKTAKGVRHVLNGNNQYANMSAAAIVAGATYAHKTGIDKRILNASKTFVRDLRL